MDESERPNRGRCVVIQPGADSAAGALAAQLVLANQRAEQAEAEVARLRAALEAAKVEHRNGPGEAWLCTMGLCPLCKHNAAIDAALAPQVQP